MKPIDYARCIDCVQFGNHGAHCDLLDEQFWGIREICVFFQWKKENTLRETCLSWFFPNYEMHAEELKLRGMEYKHEKH